MEHIAIKTKMKVQSTWQKRRTQLNHDWLQNSFLLSLSKMINIEKGTVEDSNYLCRFINELLPEWETKRSLIRQLIADFSLEMSPAILFNQFPLDRLETEIKVAFEEVTDELWRKKFPIEEWISSATNCLNNAEMAYQMIIRKQSVGFEIESLENFFIACVALSESLSSFPSKITY